MAAGGAVQDTSRGTEFCRRRATVAEPGCLDKKAVPLSHQSQSSGRFDTRKWSGQISRLSPVTVGILRFLYTDSSLEDRQSILQMAVRIPPFSKKGIRYRRMDVFPTADDPENKNTCFGITTPLSVLNEQNVSQYVKSIAEPGSFRQYQMRLAGYILGL